LTLTKKNNDMQAMLDELLKRVQQLEGLSGLPYIPSGGGDLVVQRMLSRAGLVFYLRDFVKRH